jgi:hypothetical protein
MNKIVLSIVFILLGVLLLLKNSNLLPDNLEAAYLDLARHYWPALIILFGLQLLIKERNRVLGRIIAWLILILIGLWLFCQVDGNNNWVI